MWNIWKISHSWGKVLKLSFWIFGRRNGLKLLIQVGKIWNGLMQDAMPAALWFYICHLLFIFWIFDSTHFCNRWDSGTYCRWEWCFQILDLWHFCNCWDSGTYCRWEWYMEAKDLHRSTVSQCFYTYCRPTLTFHWIISTIVGYLRILQCHANIYFHHFLCIFLQPRLQHMIIYLNVFVLYEFWLPFVFFRCHIVILNYSWEK